MQQDFFGGEIAPKVNERRIESLTHARQNFTGELWIYALQIARGRGSHRSEQIATHLIRTELKCESSKCH